MKNWFSSFTASDQDEQTQEDSDFSVAFRTSTTTPPLTADGTKETNIATRTTTTTTTNAAESSQATVEFSQLTSETLASLVSAFPPSNQSKDHDDAFPEDSATATKRTNDPVDSHIAQALGQLSMKERDRVYHELHGVSEGIRETPDFVREKLEQLDFELNNLQRSHPKAQAYNMVLNAISTTNNTNTANNDSSTRLFAPSSITGSDQQNVQQQLQQQSGASYITDPRWRLQFLRAEDYDATKAADRLIRFLDLKRYLFGSDLLLRPDGEVRFDDLSTDDQTTLKAGFLQLLPVRDRAGRAILILIPTYQTYKIAENMSRAMFYLFMCSLDDEETQRRGLACIIYDVGQFVASKTDLKTIVQGVWVQSCVPAKVCALHHCFNDSAFRAMVNLSMQFFGQEVKARAKMHHGTHLECVYALMTFGIPPDSLPVTMDGDLKRKSHLEFLKMRKSQEESQSGMAKYQRIVVPNRGDVLFGRGKPFREHIGNLRLFNLLDDHLHQYEQLKLKEKTHMIAGMVQLIQAEGGRFLMKQDCGRWTQVDDKHAREKVSHAFRTRLRIQQAATTVAPPSSVRTSTGSGGTSAGGGSGPLIWPDKHPSMMKYDHADRDHKDLHSTKRARTTTGNSTTQETW